MTDVPAEPDYQANIRRDLPRDFFVDLQAAFSAAARQAKAVIKDSHKAVEGGIVMGARRGNQSAGIVRFNLTDEAFEQIVARHGGEFIGQVAVKKDADEAPELKPVYLTTAKFGSTLVGFASHRDRQDLPSRNMSRRALCAQNVGLGPDLYRERELYSDRDRFVVVMVQRAHQDIGEIASISIAIADPRMAQFVMQVDINDFVASYGEKAKAGRKPPVLLKDVKERFRSATDVAAEEDSEKAKKKK
jgi:hypothetical protein